MRIIQGIGTKKIGEEGLLSCGHFLTPVSKTPRSTPNLPIPKPAEEKRKKMVTHVPQEYSFFVPYCQTTVYIPPQYAGVCHVSVLSIPSHIPPYAGVRELLPPNGFQTTVYIPPQYAGVCHVSGTVHPAVLHISVCRCSRAVGPHGFQFNRC